MNSRSMPSISWDCQANTLECIHRHPSIYFCKEFGISCLRRVTYLSRISTGISLIGSSISYCYKSFFKADKRWSFNCYLDGDGVEGWVSHGCCYVLRTFKWHSGAANLSPIIFISKGDSSYNLDLRACQNGIIV